MTSTPSRVRTPSRHLGALAGGLRANHSFGPVDGKVFWPHHPTGRPSLTRPTGDYFPCASQPRCGMRSRVWRTLSERKRASWRPSRKRRRLPTGLVVFRGVAHFTCHALGSEAARLQKMSTVSWTDCTLQFGNASDLLSVVFTFFVRLLCCWRSRLIVNLYGGVVTSNSLID